jgi:serine/threonine protein phosphatase PrpC
MSSDGFSNSYKNENEFFKTCRDYFDMINQYGVKAVEESLKNWLTETSTMGCGDDITVLIAYFSQEESVDHSKETQADELTIKSVETELHVNDPKEHEEISNE